MALASNALAKSAGSTVNHVVDGGAINSDAFSASGDIDNAFSNTDGYLYCDVVINVTKGGAGTANLTVALYKRPLDISSTNDQVAPSANFLADLVGVKPVDNTTNALYLLFENIWVGGRPCEFYLQNRTGQTINSGWDLDIIPWTYVPA